MKRTGRTRPPWQPPTPSADWRAEADRRIERHRKCDFVIHFTDAAGKPVRLDRVDVRLDRHAFLFGTAVHPIALADPGDDGERYRRFITDHFSCIVASDCMKWYAIEKERGVRDWTGAGKVFEFAARHGLAVRGHCLLWSKAHWVQPWARTLPVRELRAAVRRHVEDAVSRCRGRVVCWDVLNEMLDGKFFEERLGHEIRQWLFSIARRLNPDAALFLNEYTVLESEPRHRAYLALIERLRAAGLPVGGIGIQEHDAQNLLLPGDQPGRDFLKLGLDDSRLIIPHEALRRLDDYAATGLPVHLTEITSWSSDDGRRAEALADFLRLGFSHPGVQAMLLWGFWERHHFRGREACLFTRDWRALPPARAVSRLIKREWTTQERLPTDPAGHVAFRGFPGDYIVKLGAARYRIRLSGTKSSANIVLN
jgi:GH35 family endo-1,4-beta-xylanase